MFIQLYIQSLPTQSCTKVLGIFNAGFERDVGKSTQTERNCTTTTDKIMTRHQLSWAVHILY